MSSLVEEVRDSVSSGMTVLSTCATVHALPNGIGDIVQGLPPDEKSCGMPTGASPGSTDILFLIGNAGGNEPLVDLTAAVIRCVTTEVERPLGKLKFGVMEFCETQVADGDVARVTLPFSEDAEAVLKVLASLKCGGGGDGGDPISAGLERAFKEFEGSEAAAKHLVLLGSEPSGGEITVAAFPENVTIHTVAAYRNGIPPRLETHFLALATGVYCPLNVRDAGAAERSVARLADALVGHAAVSVPGKFRNDMRINGFYRSIHDIYASSGEGGDRELRTGFGRSRAANGVLVARCSVLLTRTEMRRLLAGLDAALPRLKAIRSGRVNDSQIREYLLTVRQTIAFALTGDLEPRSDAELDTIVATDLPFGTRALSLSIGQVTLMDSKDLEALSAEFQAARDRVAEIYDTPGSWFSPNNLLDQQIAFLPLEVLP